MKLASGAWRAGAIALSALLLGSPAVSQGGAKRAVDLELVLAVDVSQSMDYDEHTLQRMGYVDALRHKDVINAILAGPHGKIAIMVMEWAGDFEPIDLMPWTILDNEAAVRAFADKLANEPISGEQRTSISNALYSAADRIQKNDISAPRQVIDVSGDGANNAGPPVEQARDDVVKRGIIINGLPIMLGKPMEFYDIPHLDRYYKHCVIGGNGAFIAPVFDLKQLAATIRKKLVLEIAGNTVDPPGTAPVQFGENDTRSEAPTSPGIQRVQLKLPTEKQDCFAGEEAMGGGRGYGRFPGQ